MYKIVFLLITLLIFYKLYQLSKVTEKFTPEEEAKLNTLLQVTNMFVSEGGNEVTIPVKVNFSNGVKTNRVEVGTTSMAMKGDGRLGVEGAITINNLVSHGLSVNDLHVNETVKTKNVQASGTVSAAKVTGGTVSMYGETIDAPRKIHVTPAGDLVLSPKTGTYVSKFKGSGNLVVDGNTTFGPFNGNRIEIGPTVVNKAGWENKYSIKDYTSGNNLGRLAFRAQGVTLSNPGGEFSMA